MKTLVLTTPLLAVERHRYLVTLESGAVSLYLVLSLDSARATTCRHVVCQTNSGWFFTVKVSHVPDLIPVVDFIFLFCYFLHQFHLYLFTSALSSMSSMNLILV